MIISDETPTLLDQLRQNIAAIVSPVAFSTRKATDEAEFVRVTARLPLSSMARWEKIICEDIWLAKRLASGTRSGWWQSIFKAPAVNDDWNSDALNWLHLCNGDGYARERALRSLTKAAPNAFLFTLALRRLNDWVPQVRAAARERIPVFAAHAAPQHIADALCSLLPNWTSWGRMEESDRKIILDLIKTEAIAADLKSRITARPTGPMVQILAQVLRTPALDEYLSEISCQAVQPAVRANAYRVLLAGQATWVTGSRWKWTDIRYCQGHQEKIHESRPLAFAPRLLECLTKAAEDRSAIVRGVASETLVREMRNPSIPVHALALAFSQDKSKAVADRGDFVVRQIGP